MRINECKKMFRPDKGRPFEFFGWDKDFYYIYTICDDEDIFYSFPIGGDIQIDYPEKIEKKSTKGLKANNFFLIKDTWDACFHTYIKRYEFMVKRNIKIDQIKWKIESKKKREKSNQGYYWTIFLIILFPMLIW